MLESVKVGADDVAVSEMLVLESVEVGIDDVAVSEMLALCVQVMVEVLSTK